MKLNKKYFLAIFTALGIQGILGISLANAVCDNEILAAYQKSNKEYALTYLDHWVTEEAVRTAYKKLTAENNISEYKDAISTFEGYKKLFYTSAKDANTSDKGGLDQDTRKSCAQLHSDIATVISTNIERAKTDKYNGYFSGLTGDISLICVSRYLASNNCDFSALDKSGVNQRGSSSSSNSSTPSQSNSPESYNIQVSQTNKQNYQAVQRAYEQANAGKGKKNNLQAVGTECMKNNPSQKSFTNKCNQAINFAYCFSGIVPGYKNEHPETLAEMSCQNGQFGTLTLGAGESIPGSYKGLVLEGLACKSPSQPVGMKYNTSEPPNGRCSF